MIIDPGFGFAKTVPQSTLDFEGMNDALFIMNNRVNSEAAQPVGAATQTPYAEPPTTEPDRDLELYWEKKVSITFINILMKIKELRI